MGPHVGGGGREPDPRSIERRVFFVSRLKLKRPRSRPSRRRSRAGTLSIAPRSWTRSTRSRRTRRTAEKIKPLRLVAFDVSDGSHARGTPRPLAAAARALGNAVVGGKIVSGVLRKGLRVAIVPAGVVATVRAIEATGGGAGGDGATRGRVRRGRAVDVGLDGLDGGIDGVVAPGSVLCDPAHPARARVAFEALIDTRSTVRVPILAGTRVELFVGGARAEARVAALLELVDPESTDNKVAKTRPRCLTKNQRARVRIEVVGEEKGVCVERAEECDALGRVALRVGGKTVAAGTVTETE